MGEYSTVSPEETEALALRLAEKLQGGEVIAFSGGLGSGKTTFCKGLARGLGVREVVSSPTFAIANRYDGRIPFAHFDAYRIAGADDLEAAGFYDFLDEGAVVAVEWSENVAPWLPRPLICVDIIALQGDERKICIRGAKGL